MIHPFIPFLGRAWPQLYRLLGEPIFFQVDQNPRKNEDEPPGFYERQCMGNNMINHANGEK